MNRYHYPHYPLAPQTGQFFPPSPPSPQQRDLRREATEVRTEARELRLLDEVKRGFSEITPALILTGVAIGFASAVGNALGAIFVERYVVSQRRKRARR